MRCRKTKLNTMSTNNNNLPSLSYGNSNDYFKMLWSWVKNIKGESTTQLEITFNIMSQLTDKINDCLRRTKEQPSCGQQLLLFEEDEFNDGYYSFQIPLSEICKHKCDYADVDRAVQIMNFNRIPVTARAKDGTLMKTQEQIFKCWIPVSAHRRKGYCILQISEEMAHRVLNLDEGYVKVLKKIIDISSNHRTPNLCIYLSRKFANAEEHIIKYDDLRKELCVDKIISKPETDEYGHTVYGEPEIKVQYKAYKDFTKRILRPIQMEMDRFLYNGDMPFSFEYEPKGGNPTHIKFTRVTELSEEKKEAFRQEALAATNRDKKQTNTDPMTVIVGSEEHNNLKNSQKWITGTSLGDYELFKQLLKTGNEWATNHSSKPYTNGEFARELKKEGIFPERKD